MRRSTAIAVTIAIVLAACACSTTQEKTATAETPKAAASPEVLVARPINEPQPLHNMEVTVTHYCTCTKCCGKDDGITASGRMAVPDFSVAVDPSIIPLGTEIWMDYGDGEIHTLRADDVGGAISGDHIDLCVGSHEEALQRGVREATIWWE